ncbi:DUF1036 domain-containing protein [Paenibacillus methanolicus]|uniref:Uncharacterized protein DUF1036 n=1 Tax=Paenibacillus methanolicus TaxID=582686 RepID=A0A5S5C7Q0_9BACL|nr:uncharacterized protein DUF1036 [Paenibacillus methanolicus]
MGFNFRNNTHLTVYVAAAYYKPSCRTDSGSTIPFPNWYEAVGWYQVNPGQTVEVVRGAVNNQQIYFYAESISRSLVWSGGNTINLPQNAFRLCGGAGYCDAPLCRIVGMRRISVGNYRNYTVNLSTGSSQRKSRFRNVHTELIGKRPNVGRISPPDVSGDRVLRPRAGRKSISKR